MSRELTLDTVRAVMKPNQAKNITSGVIEELNKLASDPDYGEDFLECYMDYLNIYKEGGAKTHNHYVSALKFFVLVENGNTLTDAYIKTFPKRFEDRTKGKTWKDDQEKKDLMRGEASRYNRTKLVNEMRKAATVPVQLIHRHLLHEAILDQAELMRTSKSDMVRHLAGKTLIQELKPLEEQVLSVQVEDGARSAIEDLRIAANKLASDQREKVVNGDIDLKDIADAVIVEKEVEPDGS